MHALHARIWGLSAWTILPTVERDGQSCADTVVIGLILNRPTIGLSVQVANAQWSRWSRNWKWRSILVSLCIAH